jgi:lysophospholipase L1-like esterase
MNSSISESRRKFFTQFSLTTLSISIAPELIASHRLKESAEFSWFDASKMEIEGKGWTDTQRFFDRLPSKAEGIVRDPVWNLSRQSAGMTLRFITDSPLIQVRYKLYSERLSMSHMPATGVSGIDLYAKNSKGINRWVSVTRPDSIEFNSEIAKNLNPGSREYTMYLPLYNGVDSLEIGIPEGQNFEPVPARKDKPIVFYGTSIMHGACASRPGMAIPAILGRRLNKPTINLGFSGNGRMESEVGQLLSELNPSVYVIDCLPNMNASMIQERAEPLVKQLKKVKPNTPILLVEDRSFTNSEFFEGRKNTHVNNRKALKSTFRNLKSHGFKDIYYLQGEQLLGDDGEAATDGSHPSDLGMVRYADAYEPALRNILKLY